jgi:hypothetical protein
MGTIPAQIAELSTAWLNGVLGAPPSGGSRSATAMPVGTISDFRAERLGEGVGILGELARLHLTYAPGQSGPATMIAKCQSPAPENQFLGQVMGFYLREVNFYREVADQLQIRVPRHYHVESTPEGLPFILLLEDIADAHCPGQSAGISPEQAGSILDIVASLHASYWGRPELDAMTWLPPMNNPLYKGGQAMALDRLPAFIERFGDRIGPEMVAVIERACQAYPEMLDFAAAAGTTTLTHTDCRSENYLFGGSAGPDAITMVDFQLCTRHFGPWDVANLLGGSLTPEVRRAHEQQLVARYHARLAELGVEDYSLDQCWREVRISLLHMCTAVVITSDLQGGNERGAELLENLFLRPILAGRDHNVGELLDEFC